MAGADTIYIKGSEETVEGVIDDERSDETRVFIRTGVGLMPIPRSRIERIEVRENITPQEREGDLATQRGDDDRALELYLEAHAEAPDDATLQRKIAEIKERIAQQAHRRYAGDFADIDAAVRRRAFPDAILRAQELVRGAPDDSSRDYLLRKLSQTYLAQAREFKNMVNYAEAEKSYRHAIEASPQAAVAQLELAELVSESPSRREEAFALYREGLTYAAADPTLVDRQDLVKHRYNEAQLYFRESLHREAAELLWAVVEIDETKQYPRAPETIVRALSLIRPKLVSENEENARAIKILEGVLESEPSRADAQYLLGRIYCDRENWDETIARLEKAVPGLVGPNASTDRADARHCLAKAYRQKKRLPDAVTQLLALLQDQPTRYEARCELGEIYTVQLENQKGLEQFQEAIRIDPQIYRAYLGAARSLRQLGRYKEAQEQYEKLIGLRADHAAYYFELGLTFADLGDAAKANAQYQKAVAIITEKEAEQPSEESRAILSKAYTQMGLASVGERNYYEAIQFFDRALANHPDLAEAYDGKGQAFRELGKLDDAEGFFRKAIEKEPGNPKFLLNLGVFFHKLKKDRESALPYYMKYYEAGGNDPQVRDWIRECGGTPPKVS